MANVHRPGHMDSQRREVGSNANSAAAARTTTARTPPKITRLDFMPPPSLVLRLAFRLPAPAACTASAATAAATATESPALAAALALWALRGGARFRRRAGWRCSAFRVPFGLSLLLLLLWSALTAAAATAAPASAPRRLLLSAGLLLL